MSEVAHAMKDILPEDQLAGFIAKFTPEIAEQVHAVLPMMRTRLPGALELVYDNYNALAIGFGPTERSSEAIFSIAVFPRWLSLFFLQGVGLPDPDKLLKGSGNLVRHIVLKDPKDLNSLAIKALHEAGARAHGEAARSGPAASDRDQVRFGEAASPAAREEVKLGSDHLSRKPARGQGPKKSVVKPEPPRAAAGDPPPTSSSPGECAARNIRATLATVLAVCGLLALHYALAARSLLQENPTVDEVVHLPAGITYWEKGTFRLYHQNPPLVKLVAALPVLWASPIMEPALPGE